MKKRKAFTLIEILTVVFLGALIIIVGYSLYLISYKSYKKNYANAELAQNARIALERMSRDIRQSNEILGAGTPPTALPLDPGAGTPPSEIKFQDGHNYNPIQYITFNLDGTDLHRKISHYAFTTPDLCLTADPSTWVLWTSRGPAGELPTECNSEDRVKAEKISSLQFWGLKLITVNLAVSNDTNTFYFQTKTLARNVQ